MVYKKILITGASGLVARYIINQLSSNKDNVIYAISSRVEVLKERHAEKENIQCFSPKDLFSGKIKLSSEWLVIHCAFTRKNASELVAESLDYAAKLFELCKVGNVGAVINLSSRSVYKEPEEGELNTENSLISPSGNIGIGKYAVELLMDAYFNKTNIKYTNLRLASVNELKRDLLMIRPLNVFVEAVINRNPIKVVGGMQVMSYIDPRDIALAVEALMGEDINEWKKVYNVGTGWKCTTSLLQMAKRVVELGNEFELLPVNIEVEEKLVEQRAGLDIQRISEDTGWVPKYELDDMIKSLYKMYLEEKDV